METGEEGRWEFECVVQNMRRASRLISRRYEEALRPMDLTSSQYTILQALSGRPGIPFGLMAKGLGFDQTTLSRLLQPLKKRSLLELKPNPADGRQRLVCITKAGEGHFRKAKVLWQREHDESLNRMSGKEWNTLKRVLRKLSD